MMYPGAYMTGAMGWWMAFAFLASVALIAVLAVLVFRSDRSGRDSDSARARQLLDERLARGEIDAQEYRERCGLIAG